MTTMKVCSCCGIEKPAAKFYANTNNPDGLSNICRACAYKSRTKNKGLNPALADFQPRELIEELRARGYKGKLEFTKTITL